MAHGAPDLTDLLAVIEEPTVVPPLHQISSGQSGNLQMQIGAPGFFSPPNLPFPTELNTQPQLSQIPELDHDLSESAFLPTELHDHSFKDTKFQVESEDRGSLGSLFLSSIGHQLDPGKSENVSIVSAMPQQQDTSKIVLSKPRHQNESAQHIRNSGQLPQRSATKPNYTQFSSNVGLGSTTNMGVSGSTLKSSNSESPHLSFFLPDAQPSFAPVQTGASQKKMLSSGQFAYPHHGMRQQTLPTNPPRPHSAASNSSEHISRPGSVKQPSPSCGSSHSGDPATPLTPQSHSAGTPQPYKPATPGNPSTIQQQRRSGFVDLHHSPQMPQVGSNQQTVMGYQPHTSTTQPIGPSHETLDDLPTPIKNAFDSIGNVDAFNLQNDSIDNNSLWNAGPALMAPSALFVSTTASQLQSNPVLMTQDTNLGFGIPGDMYSSNLPVYTNRVPPRSEPSFEESLTPKQNEILNRLSAKGLKTSSALTAQLISQSGGNEGTPPAYQTSPNINTTTMGMMDKANTAGTATVEKLLGSSHYEAISPVSDDYSMSPATKSALPEELTSNLYLSSKFSSEIEIPTTRPNLSSINQDLTVPAMMYATPKENIHSQSGLPDLLGPEGVPELMGFSENDWSTSISSMPSSQLQSSLTMTSKPSIPNVTVSQHSLVSSDRWMSNDVVSRGYGTATNLPHQSSRENIRISDYAPTANSKITAISLKDTQVSPSQKQLPSHTMSVNTKEGRSFGMSRRKPSLDKPKASNKSRKTAGQSDTAFGFESDDETETIRLMPQSLPSKMPAKKTQQPNFPPVKPRTMHVVGPSDDLRQKMEAVKQLQRQQIRLQQIQAYQSQNASSASIANPNYGRQFQNKVHLVPTVDHQSQHDTARYKTSIEAAALSFAGVSRQSESTTSNSTLFGSLPTANLPTHATTLSTSASAPLPLAQPNPRYGDVSSRYKPPPTVFQSEQAFSHSRSNDVQGGPYFLESIQKPNAGPVLREGANASLTSVRKLEKPQATVSSVPYSTNSTSVSHFSSHMAEFSPPWKPTTIPPSVGVISTSSTQPSNKVAVTSGLPATSLLTTPSQPSDHSNLDWLHRESEHVMSGRNPRSRLDFLNTVTQSSAIEKIPSSALDILVSATRSSTSEKSMISSLDFLNTMPRPNTNEKNSSSTIDNLTTMTRSSVGEKNSIARPDLLNSTSRPIASVQTSSFTPNTHSHHSSSSVRSSVSSSSTSLLSEDYLVPLKQTILNVDPIGVPKSQPPISSTFVSSAMTKKHPFNFKKHRILEGALPSTNVKTTQSISTSSVFTATSDANASVAFSVLDKQRRYVKEHSNSKLKHRISQAQDKVQPSSNSASASKEKFSDPRQHVADSSKTDAAEKNGTKQGDKSGGMFELFNSLLKEASESALKSRDESKETEAEKPVVKDSMPKVAKPQPVPAPISRPGTIKGKSDQGSVPHVSTNPTSLPSKSKPVMSVATTFSVTATVATTVTTSRSTSEIKKPKKNWSSSAIPFKRRYFDDTQSQLAIASKAPVTVTTVPTVMTSSLKPVKSLPTVTTTTVVTSAELVTSSTVNFSPKITLPAKITTATISTSSKITTATISTPSKITTATISTPSKITTATIRTTVPVSSPAAPAQAVDSEKVSGAGSALKLRITAFRSSRGDIIHQSSMLNKDEEGAGSDRSSHKKSKKNKKKRDKKRKSDVLTSDDNSSVSSQPKAVPREELIEKAKLNEQITKELVELAKITTVKENDGVIASKPSPQKRKRTRAGDTDVAASKKPPKRSRVASSNPKKKPDSKVVEPVARYLPKSVLQASSGTSVVSSTSTKTTVSVPTTYQRAPGKLPLYLSSSDRKSSTAPTIQLVARSSTKVVSTAVESKSVQPSKAMGIKISKTISSRPFSTQLLTNSNVQYIIPAPRPLPRVIVPNVSTSAAVSVVSPLIVRSLPTGLVSLSTSAPNATAITKPQLFTFPLNDPASHTLKNISVKMPEKTLAEGGTTSSSSSMLIPSSAAKKPLPSVTTTNARSTTGLTGTLDTPRVTTKVLPSIIDQDANVTNFQSVLLKLVTSPNPVPNYVPPEIPIPLCQDLSENKTYQCLACEDRFLFKDSLEDHHARRSILIKVRCMQCDQDMVFLNKCRLLMHARQHSDGMQFNNAHISPLPLSMCKPRSKEWFLNNKKASNESAVQRTPSLASQGSSSPSTPLVETPPALLTTLVCTECGFIASSAEGLEEHFQRTSVQVSPEKTTDGSKAVADCKCDICSVTVPNRCSFMAHMRMHKRAKPHTCPECGKMFNDAGPHEHTHSESKREIDFNFHLSVECFHLCRITAFKCRICNLICKNAELLRRHLEDRHLQTFHKCLDCPMAFKTQDNFASHQRSAHAVSSLTKMMYKCPKTIHKCPLCDTVFTDENATQQLFLLQKHFEAHMSHPSINKTAYKCLFCNDIFEKKAQVRDHIKTVHDVVADSEGDLNASKGCIDSELKSNSSRKSRAADRDEAGPSRKISRVSSGETTTSNAMIASGTLGHRDGSKKKSKSSGDLVVGKKNAMQPLKLRLKGLGSCVRDETDANDRVDSPEADVEFSAIASVESIMRDGKRLFPCGQCSKELPSASARVNHIRLKHQGIRTLFCCPYCPAGKIKFAKKISMKKHLKKIHGKEEVTKQDVRIEHIKLPIGQRFDRASLDVEEGTANPPPPPPPSQKSSSAPTGSKVRKKFTRPGRRKDRPPKQFRQDAANQNLYLENSDSEVERIMSKKIANDASFDKGQVSDEELDFSVLKFPSVYSCGKCDHQCGDRLEFQAHIVEHKEDVEAEGITGTVQCTECGLCFASASSHVKHLFIKHKVRKRKLLEKYDEQLKVKRKAEGSLPYRLTEEFLNNPNGTCDSNVKKYKCMVCFKRFEEDAHLKTHMRTHGLAFVRSKHTS